MAPGEVTEDYYAILEVAQSAPVDDVRRNYRRLARTLHPDKNLDNPSATASFQCVGLPIIHIVFEVMRLLILDDSWWQLGKR